MEGTGELALPASKIRDARPVPKPCLEVPATSQVLVTGIPYSGARLGYNLGWNLFLIASSYYYQVPQQSLNDKGTLFPYVQLS